MSPAAGLKAAVRARFGLWPVLEVRNRVVLGPKSLAWKRFEDAEVARLGPDPTPVDVVTVIPTYRRPGLLPLAVESALAQDVPGHRVIVVDDGGGLPVLPPDPRLRAVSLSRNSGVLGLVRNVGMRLTESRIVAFLDDDNTWAPEHLSTTLAALPAGDAAPAMPPAGDAAPAMVYTAVQRRHPDGTVLDTLSRPFDRRALRDGTPYVDANAVVLRRRPDGPGTPMVLFSRLPRVKKTLPKEDWEFVYRYSRGRTVVHLPTPTVRYLVNQDSYFTRWDEPS